MAQYNYKRVSKGGLNYDLLYFQLMSYSKNYHKDYL